MQRIADINRGNAALPGARRYAVIYADPPWHFEVYDDRFWRRACGRKSLPNNAVAGHLCSAGFGLAQNARCRALPVATPGPHLPEALRVIERWGFANKANIAWVKDKILRPRLSRPQ